MITRIAHIVLLSAVVASAAGADTFENLQTNGNPYPTEKAPGAFLPVREGDGYSGWVFMIQGGLLSELNQEPIADIWLLDDDTWLRVPSSAPRVAGHVLAVGADGRGYAFGGHEADADGDLRELNEVVTGAALVIFRFRLPSWKPAP